MNALHHRPWLPNDPRGVIVLLARLGLAAVFAVAGGSKLVDPTGFATAIANYELLPQLAPYLAATLPAIEIVAAGAVLLGTTSWRRGAAALMAAMMGMFIAAGISALGRNLNVDCGCFGAGGSALTWWSVARNVALFAVAALVVWGDRAAPRAPRPAAVPLPGPGAAS